MEAQTQDLNSVMANLGAALTGSMETRLKELETSTAEVLKGLETEAKKNRPVLHVKINAGQERKLKSAAVPYLDRMLTFAELGENILLVGPAGCGKTTAAQQLADAKGLPFESLCCTAGASETWVFGRNTPAGFKEAGFSRIYKNGGVVLLDEIDAADANFLLAINTALANGVMTNPINGEVIKMHPDCLIVAGANTTGKGADFVYTGRTRLDGSTLDRFMTIAVDYDSNFESKVCTDKVLFTALTETRKKLREQQMEEILSTRTFERFQKLTDAKVPMTQIIEATAHSWTPEAQKILKAELKKAKQEVA